MGFLELYSSWIVDFIEQVANWIFTTPLVWSWAWLKLKVLINLFSLALWGWLFFQLVKMGYKETLGKLTDWEEINLDVKDYTKLWGLLLGSWMILIPGWLAWLWAIILFVLS